MPENPVENFGTPEIVAQHIGAFDPDNLQQSYNFSDTASGYSPVKTSGKPPMNERPLIPGARFFSALSDVLIGAAVIVFLYLLYLLFWTGVTANQDQNDAIASVEWLMPDDPSKIASKHYDEPPVDIAPKDGAIIGRIYIPQFGADYTKTLVEGTSSHSLATMGFGHYTKTAMPGDIGNFSAAAHRTGYGQPLFAINTLKTGDALIVRTRTTWYVYKQVSDEIVLPEQTDVIAPVPGKIGVKATERYLTYTTCHPTYNPTHRYIVHGILDYWAPVTEGIPQEMADVGTKLVN